MKLYIWRWKYLKPRLVTLHVRGIFFSIRLGRVVACLFYGNQKA